MFFSPGLSNRGLDWQQAKWYDVVSHGWEAKRADKLHNMVSGLRESLKKPENRDISKSPLSKIIQASGSSLSLSTTAGYQSNPIRQNAPDSERRAQCYLDFRETEVGKRFVAMESESIIGLGELDTRRAFGAGWYGYTYSYNFTGVTGALRRSAWLRHQTYLAYDDMWKAQKKMEAKFGANTKVAYSLSVLDASELQTKKILYEKVIESYNEWNKTLSVLENPEHEELNYWFFR
jgi:hypothetical protein